MPSIINSQDRYGGSILPYAWRIMGYDLHAKELSESCVTIKMVKYAKPSGFSCFGLLSSALRNLSCEELASPLQCFPDTGSCFKPTPLDGLTAVLVCKDALPLFELKATATRIIVPYIEQHGRTSGAKWSTLQGPTSVSISFAAFFEAAAAAAV
ncbi:hypothetical protein NE237_020623 [Protea cynaroides]|uniref:Uncharacterized protein n=1 Tax=Protea cynaroides TaxID=273540 RepID=A0A9Q0H9L4_9MAGN|nr:hypothetical protein NE237_020623 [Protea cynaroides]